MYVRIARCLAPAGNACRTVFLALAFCAATPAAAPAAQKHSGPPAAPVKPVTETHYGIKVTDPYRYMENLKAPAVKKWFREQNAYARSVLEGIPGRGKLLADIRKYDRSTPAVVSEVSRLHGDIYLYEKQLPDQQVARLYERHGTDGKERLLFDPTRYEKKGGPQWAISYYSASWDGHYVAVGISPGGSEQAVLHVVDASTGHETGEAITRTPFGRVHWRPDNHSFFYNRLRKLAPDAPKTAKYRKLRVYLHTVGTDPSKDRTVFGYGLTPRVRLDPIDQPGIFVVPGSGYAFGYVYHGVGNDISLYTAPLDSVGRPGTPWRKVVDKADQVTWFSVHDGRLYLITHKDAPRSRMIATSLKHPDVAHAETVLAQQGAVLDDSLAAHDALYVSEHRGMVGRVLRIPYGSGRPQAVPLPVEGAVHLDYSDPDIDGVLFNMTAWTRSPAVYRYDPATGKTRNTGLQPAGPYGAPADLVSKEVEVRSYDGTMVPLSIVYRRGTKLDGSHSTLLDAYGAYGMTQYPDFRPWLLAWFERGGVFAVAHVRGGGVYGERWHRAGQKLTKPNTWRDLIASAKYLIKHGYTTSARLAIMGGSAGGITVGRAMTERPDLFAAVIDDVGVSNPLRSEFTPNGPPNIPEFGSIKTQAGFEDLYAMDAYQHVRDGVKYPAVLLTTGWNDPRVAPWQAGKMAARLQAASTSGKPVLLRVDYNAGHGYGSTRSQRETELADTMSFALWQSGAPGFQPQP